MTFDDAFIADATGATDADRAPLVNPEELNKAVMLLVRHGGRDGLSREALVSMMRGRSFGGQITTADAAVRLADAFGLVSIAEGLFTASRTGRKFARLNASNTYELDAAQAEVLFDRFLFGSATADLAKQVFSNFVRDPKLGTYVATLPIEGGLRASRAVSFLRRLGAIEIVSGRALLSVKYASSISRLRQKRGMSPEELEFLLALRREQGEKAEEWVISFERARLLRAGHVLEADAIDKVSDIDVCAGYDVSSFDGAASTLQHDRFIEVKSTSGLEPRFIWTANERATAEVLNDCYWIYLLVGFGRPGWSHDLIMIKNPIAELEACGCLSVEPVSYSATVKDMFAFSSPFMGESGE